jgi:hypothetical protein
MEADHDRPYLRKQRYKKTAHFVSKWAAKKFVISKET